MFYEGGKGREGGLCIPRRLFLSLEEDSTAALCGHSATRMYVAMLIAASDAGALVAQSTVVFFCWVLFCVTMAPSVESVASERAFLLPFGVEMDELCSKGLSVYEVESHSVALSRF